MESKIKDNPIDIKKTALPDTKETWQEIASMLASLIVLDCEKKEVKMKDFNTFLSKNNINPKNTPGSEYALLQKAFLAGMKSQSERIKRLLCKNNALKTDLEDCLERVGQINLLLSAMEEEQEK